MGKSKDKMVNEMVRKCRQRESFGWKKFFVFRDEGRGRRGLKRFFCGGAVSGSGGAYGAGGWLMA